MKITPLDKYTEPRFPTRAILDEHPELLRLVPERWQRNPIVLSALAGMCLLILSARDLSADPVKKSAPRIAPIFQHGDGRGAFGCEAINPPVFLSEDEARQVIIEEGKRAGITFTPSNQTLNNIKIKGANPDYSRIDDFQPEKVSSTTRTIPLKLDGTNAKRNISFEYVSERDVDEIMGEPIYTSTVYTVETLTAAKKLREGIRTAKPAGTYAVFYDPMSSPPGNGFFSSSSQTDWEKEQAEGYFKAMKTSREQLRKQVKSFIIWLKTQGVI
ncbi:MAG: hypothetical protein ACYC27_06685 [Armatimonadota bacterium]